MWLLETRQDASPEAWLLLEMEVRATTVTRFSITKEHLS